MPVAATRHDAALSLGGMVMFESPPTTTQSVGGSGLAAVVWFLHHNRASEAAMVMAFTLAVLMVQQQTS